VRVSPHKKGKKGGESIWREGWKDKRRKKEEEGKGGEEKTSKQGGEGGGGELYLF